MTIKKRIIAALIVNTLTVGALAGGMFALLAASVQAQIITFTDIA